MIINSCFDLFIPNKSSKVFVASPSTVIHLEHTRAHACTQAATLAAIFHWHESQGMYAWPLSARTMLHCLPLHTSATSLRLVKINVNRSSCSAECDRRPASRCLPWAGQLSPSAPPRPTNPPFCFFTFPFFSSH